MARHLSKWVEDANAGGEIVRELLEGQREILDAIVMGRPLAEVLSALCRLVETQAAQPARAAIFLVSDSRLWIGAAPSVPDEYRRAIDGMEIASNVGAVRGEVVVTTQIATDPAWTPLRRLALGMGLKAAWSMPIISSRGAVLGAFETYFLEPREPSAHERRLVEVLASTAAIAIERQRSDETSRASAEDDRFLTTLAEATQPLADVADVMSVTVRLLAEHLGVERCVHAEVENEQEIIVTGEYARNVSNIPDRWSLAEFAAGCMQALHAGKPCVVSDAEEQSDVAAEEAPVRRVAGAGAGVCAPLHKEGKLIAVLAVHQMQPRRWTAAEVELVSIVAARSWEALERLRVTRVLKESESRYRTIVEATPECVKLVAADGSLLQMNPAGLRMIEAPEAGQAIGQSVYSVIAPEHRDAFRAFNEQVCRGESGVFSFDIVGMSGARRSMETTAVPLPAASGGFVQLAITRDVTARVAAQRELAESRARLEYAVRLSGVGFWYCDLPFDELNWDARVKDHFFLATDARVTLDDFYARIHADDREATRAAIETSIRNRTSYDVVYRTVDPASGAVKWIRALGGTAYAADGTPKHFDGVTVDVTAVKTDQERLAKLLYREQERGRLMRAMAEAALVVHAADTVEGVLKALAQNARNIVGVQHVFASAGDSGNTTEVASVAGEDRDAREHALDPEVRAQALRSVRPIRLPGRDETRTARLVAPLIGRDGVNLGIVQFSEKRDGEFSEIDEAILLQLSQVAAVALENAQLYNELREQDRRKDEFIATLAHELRNPLAPIRTGLQILQLSDRPEHLAKARQMMERQLAHLVHMVDDLLDISRITLGKLALRKERLDFRSVLHSALETVRPFIEARGHELAVRVAQDPLPIEVDPTRLAQVIANLLNNAAKYTPAGGRIQLAAEPEGAHLVVRITDTGIGIPADMVDRVFDMFIQVGRSMDRADGGLGVGLALVRRILELHGGSIRAESPGADKGSTFVFRLPLIAAANEPSPTAAVSQAAPQTRLRILVVDDNKDAAESLAMMLELSGHDTRLAYSGPEALDAARQFLPQVVVLDIGLPGLNGYEVAQRLREDPAFGRPLLAALTGWGAEEDQRRARSAGFDWHFVKPVDASKLEDVLTAAQRKTA